jgi:hypothetical protein
VLFEFLTRFEEDRNPQIADPAERYALWKLQGCLEETLVEPFKPDYEALLQRAQAKLREQYGDDSEAI